MPKYNKNAGFKGYENDLNNSEEEEVVQSNPRKIIFIVGLIVITVVIVFSIVVAMILNGSEDEEATRSEVFFTEQQEETFDYESVFGHKENEEPTDEYIEDTTFEATSSKKDSSKSGSSKKESSSKEDNDKKNTEVNNNYGNAETHRAESSSQINQNSNSNSNQQSYIYQNSTPTPVKPPSQSSTPKTIYVSSVSLSNSSMTLTAGKSAQLYASIYPSNADNKSITWSSSNNTIASVSNGKVFARQEGSARIIASSSNGKKAYCTVTVKSKPTTPVVKDNRYCSPKTITIHIGQTEEIKLIGDSSGNDCDWEYSNVFVVKTYSRNNHSITVQGTKVGITNVIAIARDGKRFQAKVTVIK